MSDGATILITAVLSLFVGTCISLVLASAYTHTRLTALEARVAQIERTQHDQ